MYGYLEHFQALFGAFLDPCFQSSTLTEILDPGRLQIKSSWQDICTVARFPHVSLLSLLKFPEAFRSTLHAFQNKSDMRMCDFSFADPMKCQAHHVRSMRCDGVCAVREDLQNFALASMGCVLRSLIAYERVLIY